MKELHDIDLKQLIEDETGNRFNRQGHICCPFHTEKSGSLAIKFFPDTNKQKFKCFGCGENGDAIDFISKLKGIGYKEAREYLGMENTKSSKEVEFEKVKGFCIWQTEKTDNKKGYVLKGLFPFVNNNNDVIYYKAKFLAPNGKKYSSYYHLEGDKVVNNRNNLEEVPYNLYNALDGLDKDKVLIVVEGEKDANKVNAELKGNNYVATSLKGVKNFEPILRMGMRVYVIKDTGEAGEQYGNKVYEELIDYFQ